MITEMFIEGLSTRERADRFRELLVIAGEAALTWYLGNGKGERSMMSCVTGELEREGWKEGSCWVDGHEMNGMIAAMEGCWLLLKSVVKVQPDPES